MSPTNLHQPQINLNGPRPTPLMVNKESHPIRKSSSSISSFTTSTIGPRIVGRPEQRRQQQPPQQPKKNNPVIIYTESPKVIHTRARDFMALVQKLTGFSRSIDANHKETLAPTQAQEIVDPKKSVLKKGNVKGFEINDKESSRLEVIEENPPSGKRDDDDDDDDDDNEHGSGVENMLQNLTPSSNSFLADIPLFTPSSTHFFFSPTRSVGRYPGSVYVSPKMGNPISPSVYEFFKGLPEY